MRDGITLNRENTFRGGDRLLVPAPYDQIPIHVKAGSIIPLGPDIQYVGEKPGEPVTFYIYGGADAAFTLYEDQGLNNNYEMGAFSKIPITYHDASKKVVFGRRDGSFAGMVNDRKFRIVLVDKDHTRPLDFEAQPDQTIKYKGIKTSIQL